MLFGGGAEQVLLQWNIYLFKKDTAGESIFRGGSTDAADPNAVLPAGVNDYTYNTYTNTGNDVANLAAAKTHATLLGTSTATKFTIPQNTDTLISTSSGYGHILILGQWQTQTTADKNTYVSSSEQDDFPFRAGENYGFYGDLYCYVSGQAFTDGDLDDSEIGGLLTWFSPQS